MKKEDGSPPESAPKQGAGRGEERSFTVGELAQLCGVTVRTLQYYDRSGLLRAAFTEGGRRVYTSRDLLQLQQILFLKSLGFPLEKIREQLDGKRGEGLVPVFARQREILLAEMANLQKMVDTLELAIGEAREEQEVSLERLISILQLMKEGNPFTFVLRYFSDDQFAAMGTRFASQKAYENFMARMSAAFARLGELAAAGADPRGSEGQELAAQWWSMASEFADGDAEILRTLVASGEDLANWPAEVAPLKDQIERFLSPALQAYLEPAGAAGKPGA